MGDSGDTPLITGIHTVAVPVSHQDDAVALWTSVLGLEIRMDTDFGGGLRWIEVAAPGSGPGTTTVALPLADPRTPVGGPTGIRLTTTDAAAVRKTLLAHGVEVGEMLHIPQSPPMFEFRDKDANGFVVVELGPPED